MFTYTRDFLTYKRNVLKTLNENSYAKVVYIVDSPDTWKDNLQFNQKNMNHLDEVITGKNRRSCKFIALHTFGGSVRWFTSKGNCPQGDK